ncbi:MAG: N-acetylglucosamine-6-phosphate deacetylase [Xanthomonadales bacterium]
MSTLVNGRVFDGESIHDHAGLRIADGRIVERFTGPADDGEPALDLQGHLLAPGLIDLQVNGGGGVLFNDAPSVATLRTIAAAHRRFGTTGFLPTLISAPPEAMEQAVEAVREALAAGVPGVLGIHLEGPFLDPAARGIHAERHLRPLREDDLEWLCALPGRLPGGRVLLTVAPETVGPDAIRRLDRAGVVVFGGHSAARYAAVRGALDAGLRGFTHLFNAMSPLTSREPGMVGAALEDAGSWVGLIADGHHVHPASLAVAVRAKPRGRSVLVTDAMATVGAPGARFDWDGRTVTARDGCCRLPDGALAGSDLDMIRAVRNIMRFAALDRDEALRMASAYPAAALGVDGELGVIRPGCRASFIELDAGLNVRRSWIDGEMADYTGEAPRWKS